MFDSAAVPNKHSYSCYDNCRYCGIRATAVVCLMADGLVRILLFSLLLFTFLFNKIVRFLISYTVEFPTKVVCKFFN